MALKSLTIRQRAQRLLVKRGVRGGHLATSKLYRPEESWTKDSAWWVQIPWSAVRAGKTIHIVLEAAAQSPELRYLQVPAAYFRDHERDLSLQEPDKISLFLSADPKYEFQDHRGSGRIPFAQFEQNAPAA